MNNWEWYKDMNIITFLRDIGKHFKLNSMLSKDSVKLRQETNEGISFTEFSYQIFQAYDFLQLFEREKCTIQIGGSDQWGNISGGIDLIHRLKHEQGYGVTVPLLTTASGVKIGKSTGGGSVWLSTHKTSSYDFYQHLIRTEDSDVEKYLKLFTTLPLEEIQHIMQRHNANPGERAAQKALAEQVTLLVHGQDALQAAQRASSAFFGGSAHFTAVDLDTVLKDAPRVELSAQQVLHSAIVNVAVAAQLVPSKSEAKRLISGGGLYLNNKQLSDLNYKIEPSDVIDNKYCVLRSGKKNYRIICLQ